MQCNEWTNAFPVYARHKWQNLVIWSLGQQGGHNKASPLAKSSGSFGKEVLARCLCPGREQRNAKCWHKNCFRGLQLGAHPGDHLHDDPGAGLLQHGDRRRVGNALKTLPIHCQQTISTFQFSILKWGEVMKPLWGVEILTASLIFLCRNLGMTRRRIITRCINGINVISDVWNSPPRCNTFIPGIISTLSPSSMQFWRSQRVQNCQGLFHRHGRPQGMEFILTNHQRPASP